jgi:hypothetical protein
LPSVVVKVISIGNKAPAIAYFGEIFILGGSYIINLLGDII